MFRIPRYGNYLAFGTKNGVAGSGGKAIKPEEAWNIDTKMDDGRPAQGKVIGKFWNNECTTPNTGAASNTNLDVSYLLTETGIQCALHFIEVF